MKYIKRFMQLKILEQETRALHTEATSQRSGSYNKLFVRESHKFITINNLMWGSRSITVHKKVLGSSVFLNTFFYAVSET